MLVVDANILIRAVLGVRVETLITRYAGVGFCAPDTAWTEAREHLPQILRKRGVPLEPALVLLNSLEEIVQPIGFETYGPFEEAARTRLVNRDLDDWPILATALVLGAPIWTEDNDFFGTGVATWTTDRVELFLSVP